MPWKTLNQMQNRTEFVLRAQKTDNFRALCLEYGISPRVGYKWQKRFLEHGLGGLNERSRKPKRNPNELSEEVVCRIVKLKQRHPHWGANKLREIYRREWGDEPAESSFKRVLEKAGMTQKRRVRSAKSGGRIADGRKASAPNEIWTVDFKGWWYDPMGRCEPLTVRDEFSRCILELRAVANARTETVRACFEQLFERHGLPQAIRSDNGAPFAAAQGLLGLSRLSAWWLALGIDLERSRPGCPQDNGAHERMHRDISAQLEGTSYGERQAAFDVWRQEFNEIRPHESLGMQTPSEVYEPSPRRYSGTPEILKYEAMVSRKVQNNGRLKWEGKTFSISHALAGWDVGLQPNADGFDVYFANLLLGQIELSTSAFLPVVAKAHPQQAPLRTFASSATPQRQNSSVTHAAETKLQRNTKNIPSTQPPQP